MRLGGPILSKHDSPEGWAKAVKELGYGAALCPVGPEADDARVGEYAAAAAEADIIIAEVGAWNNPLSPVDKVRIESIERAKQCLALADRIGARCCVNVAGSRGTGRVIGPDKLDMADDAFDAVVDSVREIIDAVGPERSFYTLEPMPWMVPVSIDEYVRLIKAVDRPGLAVHLDPVNWINSPAIYYAMDAFIDECFAKLGPMIKSCHIKDIALQESLTVHLKELAPGLGSFNIGRFLRNVERIDPDMPVMVEHLHTPEEYKAAADHVRLAAREQGVALKAGRGL